MTSDPSSPDFLNGNVNIDFDFCRLAGASSEIIVRIIIHHTGA